MKMQHRWLIQAVLVIGCIVTLQHAAAGGDVHLQTGQWQVGPIGNGAMCSLKNTWGSERLVFARDAKGRDSVALDMAAPTLEPGRQYPVTLDVPPILTRDMTGVAATRQLLLLSLGENDRPLRRALTQAVAIYITFSQQEKAYDVSGFGEAEKQLTTCVQNLKPTLQKTTMTAPTPPPAQEDKVESALLRENAALKQKLKIAEAEIVSLRAQVKGLEQDKAQLQSALDQTRKNNRMLTEPLKHGKIIPSSRPLAHKKTDKPKLAAARGRPSPSTPVTVVTLASKSASVPELLRAVGVNSEGARPTQPGASWSMAWRTASLEGGVEQKPRQPGEHLSDQAALWFSRMKDQCSGDFSHRLSSLEKRGSLALIRGEAACIGQGKDMAVAVLFIGDDASFTVLTHKGTPQALQMALSRRETLVAAARRLTDRL